MFEIGISYFRILFLLVLREVFHLNFTLFNVELNCNCKKRGLICISRFLGTIFLYVEWNMIYLDDCGTVLFLLSPESKKRIVLNV